jgi:hypothetical protein
LAGDRWSRYLLADDGSEWVGWSWRSCRRRWGFEVAFEHGAGGGGVAQGGHLGEPEDGGEVAGVAAGGGGFFAGAVDADLFEGDADAGEAAVAPVVADRAVLVAGGFGDEEVAIGGVGPALPAVVEVFEDGSEGQVVEGPGVAADGGASVGPVDDGCDSGWCTT